MSKPAIQPRPGRSARADAATRVWLVLRIIAKRASADAPSIALAARVAEPQVAAYLGLLQRAGYLRSEDRDGTPRVRLIRDTGPHRPRRCFDAMQDQNNGKVFQLSRAARKARLDAAIAEAATLPKCPDAGRPVATPRSPIGRVIRNAEIDALAELNARRGNQRRREVAQ